MADKTIPALKILRGKVGINTATPDSNHNLTISNTANYGIRLTGTNATIQANANLIETAGNNIYLRPGSGYEVIIDSGDGLYVTSGNVGIGTNAPAYKLEVKASVTGNWLSRIYNTATSGNSSGLLVRMDEPGSTGSALGVYANGGYKFKVEPDGEVQILSGSAYTTHLNYQNLGTHYITMANGGATYFRGSSNSITTMTVLGTGSVGIGGTPSAALDIFAANASSIAIRIVGGNKVQFLNAASNTNANIYNAGSTGNSDLTFQISGTSMYTMTSGSLYPVANGTKDLGLSGNRWNNVYSEAGNFSGTITCQGSIDLQDNDKLLLGTANDLEIYHDGSNNYINSVIANGDLILDTAQNFYIKHSGETMIQGVNDGAVNLFYNGTKTFETNSTGVTVGPTHGSVTFNNTSSVSASTIIQQTYNGGTAELRIGSNVSTTAVSAMNILTGNAGVVQFNGFVGIGTASTMSSSGELLGVYSASTGHASFKNSSDSFGTVYIRNVSTTANTWQPYLILADSGGNRGGLGLKYSTAGLKVHGQGGIEFWTGGSFGGGSVKMTVASGGSVGIGTNNPSCLLQLGTDGVQGGASLAIRRNGDSINFGHVNGAGYGSVIGCSSNNGQPHIGFMCEAGTNINTFRTRGLKGNVIYTNTSGTLYFAQVTNANADNQSLTDRVAIESDGDAYFYGGNWYCNHNNSSNVTNGGLYINRGGGLYAYALATARSGTALNGVDFWDYHGVGLVFGPDSSTKVLTVKSNIGIGTTDPAYKLDVYGADARIGTNLRLGNGSAAGNSTNPAITVSAVNTAGVYFENSGVGFGAGSGSKYLFLSSAGNASLGGNGFFKQLGDRPYGTDNLNDYYRSNDEASFCQFYRYDATHGHWANSSGTITTNAPSTLTQTPSQIYSYGALFTLRSISSFRGQFYFAHSASEFYWRSGWGTSSDQNWTRIVGDRNIQSVINNVGTVSIGGASATGGVALSVKGDTEFLDGDTGTRIGLLYDNGTEGILELRDNNVTKTSLRTAGSSYFIGGNVGIGTNAPEAALTVADSTAHQAIFRTAQTTASERAGGGFSSLGSSTATSRYARLFLDADGANFSGTDYFTIEKFGSSGVVKFLQYSNANMSFWVNTSTEALTIWKNGNVGVGTNTPNGLLNVAGNTKIGTAGSPYSGTNITSLTINGVYPVLSLGNTSNRFSILAYSTYTNYETVSNAHHVFSGGNVGVSTTSPAATLDVKQGTATNNNKLMKVAEDVLSVYKVTGLSNHTVTLTCGSYFQAEVVITANQTNGGTYNNLYIRGIWSNNHTSHHWDEIENIGSLTGSSFSITVGQNDVTNSGKLTITHTYSSGSFSQMVVRVTDLYGSAHSYSIT